MAAEKTTEEYSGFPLQFDDQYNFHVREGHKHWIEKELFHEIREKFQDSAEYRILSVGSGTGSADAALLGVLSNFVGNEGQKGQKIVYTVVEPDPKAVEVCKRTLDGFSKELNIHVNYQIVPSETYLLQLEEQFELIHFVHVLSWLKEYEKILARCFDKMIAPGGTVAVVELRGAEEGADSECQEGVCGGKENEAGSEPSGPMSVQVDAIAEKQNWKCRKFPNTIRIDLTEIYKDTDQGRKQAKTWIDLQGMDASSLTEEEYAKWRNGFINSVESAQVGGERQYFYSLDETIFILINA